MTLDLKPKAPYLTLLALLLIGADRAYAGASRGSAPAYRLARAENEVQAASVTLVVKGMMKSRSGAT